MSDHGSSKKPDILSRDPLGEKSENSDASGMSGADDELRQLLKRVDYAIANSKKALPNTKEEGSVSTDSGNKTRSVNALSRYFSKGKGSKDGARKGSNKSSLVLQPRQKLPCEDTSSKTEEESQAPKPVSFTKAMSSVRGKTPVPNNELDTFLTSHRKEEPSKDGTLSLEVNIPEQGSVGSVGQEMSHRHRPMPQMFLEVDDGGKAAKADKDSKKKSTGSKTSDVSEESAVLKKKVTYQTTMEDPETKKMTQRTFSEEIKEWPKKDKQALDPSETEKKPEPSKKKSQDLPKENTSESKKAEGTSLEQRPPPEQSKKAVAKSPGRDKIHAEIEIRIPEDDNEPATKEKEENVQSGYKTVTSEEVFQNATEDLVKVQSDVENLRTEDYARKSFQREDKKRQGSDANQARKSVVQEGLEKFRKLEDRQSQPEKGTVEARKSTLSKLIEKNMTTDKRLLQKDSLFDSIDKYKEIEDKVQLTRQEEKQDIQSAMSKAFEDARKADEQKCDKRSFEYDKKATVSTAELIRDAKYDLTDKSKTEDVRRQDLKKTLDIGAGSGEGDVSEESVVLQKKVTYQTTMENPQTKKTTQRTFSEEIKEWRSKTDEQALKTLETEKRQDRSFEFEQMQGSEQKKSSALREMDIDQELLSRLSRMEFDRKDYHQTKGTMGKRDRERQSQRSSRREGVFRDSDIYYLWNVHSRHEEMLERGWSSYEGKSDMKKLQSRQISQTQPASPSPTPVPRSASKKKSLSAVPKEPTPLPTPVSPESDEEAPEPEPESPEEEPEPASPEPEPEPESPEPEPDSAFIQKKVTYQTTMEDPETKKVTQRTFSEEIKEFPNKDEETSPKEPTKEPEPEPESPEPEPESPEPEPEPSPQKEPSRRPSSKTKRPKKSSYQSLYEAGDDLEKGPLSGNAAFENLMKFAREKGIKEAKQRDRELKQLSALEDLYIHPSDVRREIGNRLELCKAQMTKIWARGEGLNSLLELLRRHNEDMKKRNKNKKSPPMGEQVQTELNKASVDSLKCSIKLAGEISTKTGQITKNLKLI